MRQLKQTWTIGRVDFHLVEGDLFEAPVDAIVNSEQTDFLLAGNPNTISGQIWRRFGAIVQPDLDDQTEGRILPVGTVLSTRGGDDYQMIFHVGFHEPYIFPASDDDQTEYLHIIRRCVRQVLNLATKDGLKSVGFPLLGTGLFGLDPALLAYEFMAEVAQFASDATAVPHLDVWLVVRQEDFTQAVLDGVVQALIDRAAPGTSWELLNLGVSYLDLYEKHCARSDHPTWSAWQICRYCELLTGFLFYNLAVQSQPPERPEKSFDRGKPITFGAVRTWAVKLAKALSSQIHGQTWLAYYTSIVHQDATTARKLEQINQDRNSIAHGRQSRRPAEIRASICIFLQISRWQDHLQLLGPPDVSHLSPWLHQHDVGPSAPTAAPVMAILDQLDRDAWWYLVPHTGHLLKVNNVGQ